MRAMEALARAPRAEEDAEPADWKLRSTGPNRFVEPEVEAEGTNYANFRTAGRSQSRCFPLASQPHGLAPRLTTMPTFPLFRSTVPAFGVSEMTRPRATRLE